MNTNNKQQKGRKIAPQIATPVSVPDITAAAVGQGAPAQAAPTPTTTKTQWPMVRALSAQRDRGRTTRVTVSFYNYVMDIAEPIRIAQGMNRSKFLECALRYYLKAHGIEIP